MDYSKIMSFIKSRKPYMIATLENTSNDNAASSREYIEEAYAKA
jgi:hypothetical protein